jgi:anion-transporting  ArsA/GET3 family ATPase
VMVDSLGGTHEYAAMERLLEFSKDSRFDAVVVDTPPSQNAVDLLSAPQRLADFMDNSVLRWFQGTRPVFQIFKTGTKLALKVLQKVLGTEFMDNLASFFDELEGMQLGFRERNLEVLEKLRGKESAFYLVTFPSEPRFQESVAFTKTLAENRIPLAGVWLNRVEVAPPLVTNENLEPNVKAILDYYGAIGRQQAEWVHKFKDLAGDIDVKIIPRQNAAPHDVESLTSLARFLVS